MTPETAAMESVTAAMTTALGFVPTVITAITGQPVLAIFMGTSMIGIGIGLFRKLKRAAR